MYQQHRKLAEDREQLKTRLDAEEERLTLRLKHASAARELDALRRVLDDGSVRLEECRRTLREIGRLGLWFDDPREAPDEVQVQMKAKDAEFRRAHERNVTEGKAIDSRIRLWLPDGDPIHAAFRSSIEAINDVIDVMEDGRFQEGVDQNDALSELIADFQDEARKRVGLMSLTLTDLA